MESSYNICLEIKKAFGCGIASIPTDNAGSCVARMTALKLGTEGEPKDRDQVLACRDAPHTLDLMPKNLMKTTTIAAVMAEAKEVYNFFSHRVNSIRAGMVRDGTINEQTTVKNVVDTRMNLTEIHLTSARKQSKCLAVIADNQEWIRYYNERSLDTKAQLDQFLQNCNHGCQQRMNTVIGLVAIFKKAHLLCSRRDTPLSAYILIVQAVKNMVTEIIGKENGKYDRILGEGAAQEVVDCIAVRFNMDGRPIPGRKVPLLDKQNLWTLFMDPYSFLWRSTFSIVGSLRAHATEMIAFFVPHHAPRYQLRRVALLEEFEVSIITNSFCNNIYECTFSPNQINDCVFISICRSFGHTLDAGPIFGTCQFQMMSAWKKRIFATGTLI